MNPDDGEVEEAKDDNTAARAILFRIFATDLIELIGQEKSQISRMFAHTFTISPNTKVGDLF